MDDFDELINDPQAFKHANFEELESANPKLFEEKQEIFSKTSSLTPEENHKFKNQQKTRKSIERWDEEEDNLLLHAYEKFGGNWCEIAKIFKNRTAKQCREHYKRVLDPNLKKGNWTEQEDIIILELYQMLGPKWQNIGKQLHRSDNAVKSRFQYLNNKISPNIFHKFQRNSVPIIHSQASSIPTNLYNGHSIEPYFDSIESNYSYNQSHHSIPAPMFHQQPNNSFDSHSLSLDGVINQQPNHSFGQNRNSFPVPKISYQPSNSFNPSNLSYEPTINQNHLFDSHNMFAANQTQNHSFGHNSLPVPELNMQQNNSFDSHCLPPNDHLDDQFDIPLTYPSERNEMGINNDFALDFSDQNFNDMWHFQNQFL